MLRLAAIPTEILDGDCTQVRLHQVPINGPRFAALHRGVPNIKDASDFAYWQVLNQAMEIPHGGAELIRAAMILIQGGDSQIAIQCRQVAKHRFECGELWQDRLPLVVAVESESVARNAVFNSRPQQRFRSRLAIGEKEVQTDAGGKSNSRYCQARK